MGSRFEYPLFQAFDNNGDPLSGGWLYSFVPGDDTPKPLYHDSLLTTPWTNPIVLNSRGEPSVGGASVAIYGSGGYKLVLTHTGTIEEGVYIPGVQIWAIDNVYGIGGGEGGVSVCDYGGDLADAVTDIGAEEVSLYINCDCIVDANLDVPDNINLRYVRGSTITVLTGITLTIGNMTDPGPFQIFNCVGTGAVVFSAPISIRPEWFGAVINDDSVCSATASNLARTAIATCGGEIVFLAGIYYAVDTPFTFSSRITLRGVGSQATKLKMADGANLDATCQTYDWDNLEDSNTWYVDTESCPYGFGLVGITFDGNRDNNTAGWALRTYGKGFLMDDIIVKDGYTGGWWSECGNKTGQHDASDGSDIPETKIGYVMAIENNGTGIQWRGPHDAYMDNIYSCRNEGYGLHTKSGTNYSAAGLVINQLHTYTNWKTTLDTPGVYLETTIMGGNIIVEDGMKIASTANQVHMKYLKFRLSGVRDHTAFECLGDDLSIGILRPGLSADEDTNDKVAVRLAGQRGIIASMVGFIGAAEYSIWLDLDGDGYQLPAIALKGSVTGGPHGTAIRIGQSGASNRNIVNATIVGCDTVVNYVTSGVDNRIIVEFLAEDGTETLFTGDEPDHTDRFDLQMLHGTTRTFKRNTIKTIQVAKTTDYQILEGENGTVFNDFGCLATVKFTLPAGKVGMKFGFVRRESGAGIDLHVAPYTNEYIAAQQNGYISIDAIWDTVYMECVAAGRWIICGGNGSTVTFVP